MGSDWPLQVSWLLEFRAFALGTGELVTKRLEFGPARLLIANGYGSVGIVLEMASELFNLALLQRYEETAACSRYCERQVLQVDQPGCERPSAVARTKAIGIVTR